MPIYRSSYDSGNQVGAVDIRCGVEQVANEQHVFAGAQRDIPRCGRIVDRRHRQSGGGKVGVNRAVINSVGKTVAAVTNSRRLRRATYGNYS